jgi:xyloglucan 6-xylosyltransferase
MLGRASKVGLLPCLFILFLWFILPTPRLPTDAELSPETKQAALRALRAARSHRLQRITGKPTDPALQRRKVMLVTAVSPQKCESKDGSHIVMLSLKNKQDYASRHRMEFYVGAHQSDPGLKGAWNKVALVRDLMYSRQDLEWFIWMDYDALVTDLSFKLPWDQYQESDFILWGDYERLYTDGDAHMGLNTGVFIVRNSRWAREMFNETSKYGTGNGKSFEPVMQQALGKYEWALFDQNGFAYVLKYWQPEEAKKRVFLETSYVLNGYWKDLPTDRLSEINPFVKHYMGCQFCSGINADDSQVCVNDFLTTWQYADTQVRDHQFQSKHKSP